MKTCPDCSADLVLKLNYSTMLLARGIDRCSPCQQRKNMKAANDRAGLRRKAGIKPSPKGGTRLITTPKPLKDAPIARLHPLVTPEMSAQLEQPYRVREIAFVDYLTRRP